MADDTRLRTLEENLNRVEAQLAVLNRYSRLTAEDTHLSTRTRTIEENLRRVEAQLDALNRFSHSTAEFVEDTSRRLENNQIRREKLQLSVDEPVQWVDDLKIFHEESEASEQVTDSCEDSVEMLQEDVILAQDSELESLENSGEYDHGILEAPPTKLNWEIIPEATNLSFSNNFEFRGNNSSLNLEPPVFGEFFWARQCEKHSMICGVTDARHVFVEMPIRGFIGNAYPNQVCKARLHLGSCVFDPGIVEGLNYTSDGLRECIPLLASHEKDEVANSKKMCGYSNPKRNGNSIYSFGGDLQECNHLHRIMNYQILMPYDRGKKALIEEMGTSKEKNLIASDTCGADSELTDMFYASIWPGKTDEVLVIEILAGFCTRVVDNFVLVFDPGGYLNTTDFWAQRVLSYQLYDATCMVPLLWISKVVNMTIAFDPGGRDALPLLTIVTLVFDPGIQPTEDKTCSLKEVILRSIGLVCFCNNVLEHLHHHHCAATISSRS